LITIVIDHLKRFAVLSDDGVITGDELLI